MDIITQSGKRIRRSTKTKEKRAAQELHDKVAYEQWRVESLGDSPKILWDEAALRWIKEREDKKSINDDISKIRALKDFRGVFLNDIDQTFIMEVIGRLECSCATKNRYLALIRAILNRCIRVWKYLAQAPVIIMFHESKGRIRWLRPEEAKRLINALSPEYLADMAVFTLNTGLRQANVFGLKWEQIDLGRRVAWYYPDEMKADNPLGVALNEAAMSIILKYHGMHSEYVFVNTRGIPVMQLNHRLWVAALQRSSIENFRWHDLRHTWASWLVQRGVPLRVIQEMGGWKTLQMVMRYSHLAPDHLHEYASKLDDFKGADTNLPHPISNLKGEDTIALNKMDKKPYITR
ncbi:tyrosine-type recombinase/integrase [Snodgrassella sp. CFCC 13594]|uniref:tyrosine-type recombinase/integrase n=1 Tax=Snodgrassella sp. CFCC 13594 TaxID=1775559 RepID=UPI00350FCF70